MIALVSVDGFTYILLCNRCLDFKESWQKASTRSQVCFSCCSVYKDDRPGFWLADTLSGAAVVKWSIYWLSKRSRVLRPGLLATIPEIGYLLLQSSDMGDISPILIWLDYFPLWSQRTRTPGIFDDNPTHHEKAWLTAVAVVTCLFRESPFRESAFRESVLSSVF